MREPNQKLTLDRALTYQIKVPGELDANWLEWGQNLILTIERDMENLPVTILTGSFDQAALHGLLRRLYALGLPLISAICTDAS